MNACQSSSSRPTGPPGWAKPKPTQPLCCGPRPTGSCGCGRWTSASATCATTVPTCSPRRPADRLRPLADLRETAGRARRSRYAREGIAHEFEPIGSVEARPPRHRAAAWGPRTVAATESLPVRHLAASNSDAGLEGYPGPLVGRDLGEQYLFGVRRRDLRGAAGVVSRP